MTEAPDTLAPSSAQEAGDGPRIITFGCRLNTFESEVMRSHAAEAALAGQPRLKNSIIVNTCAVTGEAVRQARQAIRKARRENPGADITVTGCAAQIDPDAFANMPEVTRVLGNEEKLKLSSFASPAKDRVAVDDIMGVTKSTRHTVDGLTGRARAYVQVQTGCDHRCTFCIIPFGRGNSRSVPIDEVVEQVKRLVGNGYREVVLTGVDITSYGPDLDGNPTLGMLCGRILSANLDLERLRISSIDSVEVDETLFELITHEKRLMPHLHLSLQSGDDMILKRMKRRHSRDDAIAFCTAVRKARPEIVFGADLIAGFPTETRPMFEQSMALVDECGLTYLHVFPYSPRPGTPAGRMPQLNGSVVKERANELRGLGEKRLAAFLTSRIGRTEQVLMERVREGRTENFAMVKFAEDLPPGSIQNVHLTDAAAKHLIGEPVR